MLFKQRLSDALERRTLFHLNSNWIAANFHGHLPLNPGVIFESLSIAANILETIYYNCSSGITELLPLHMCTHAHMQGIVECSAAIVQSTAATLLCQVPRFGGIGTMPAWYLTFDSSCLSLCVGVHLSCRVSVFMHVVSSNLLWYLVAVLAP